jgi:uncharacterized repeat protein (TIGR03803 family)
LSAEIQEVVFMRRITTGIIVVLVFTMQSLAQGAKVKVLRNFGSGTDGNVPAGPLHFDNHGNLYGVTSGGPGLLSGVGLVFELTPQKNGGWHENVLHVFTGGSGAAYPWGGVLFDNSGNVYGTAEGYGSYAVGGIFELSPSRSGWNFNMLYSGGAGPGVLFDKVGNLYGSIGVGDYFGAGAVGELSPGSTGWTYSQIYSACGPTGCPGGYTPPAPPIWDGKGNFWGVMTYGGITQSPCITSFGCGVIYEVTPNGDGTWTYNVMYQFASSSTDGQLPVGGLVRDAGGAFYGSTLGGGSQNLGTIFKLAYTGGQWVETTLYDFPDCTNGCVVEGTLARDKDGDLYGTAEGGTGSCGGYTCGVVFKLAPQKNGTWKYSVLVDLTPTTGGLPPFYGVILDSSGNLYGVTSSYGKYGFGTAFEITP